MSLHVEVSGHGAPLVMLHGWGMHGGAWGDVVARLAQSFTVHNVDLPGHGFSKNVGWVEHSDTHQSLAWRRQWVSLRSTHPTRLFSGVFLRQLLLLHLRDIALQLHHDVAIRLDEFAAGAAFDFAAAVGHFEQAFHFDHRMDAADAG